MNDERWNSILGQLKDSNAITIVDEGVEDLSEEDGLGTVAFVEFEGPMGHMRLEHTTRPLILDRKTHGSKRIGSHTDVQYVYSDTEVTQKFAVYKYDDAADDWQELKIEAGDMSF